MWSEIVTQYGTMGERALALEDRYYLLCELFGRVDMAHPWLYDRCREVEAAPDDHLAVRADGDVWRVEPER